LPPGARYDAGVGLVYNGSRVAVDYDFGLNENYFVFVGYDHFWEHDYHHYMLPHDRLEVVFRGSTMRNDYRVVGGHFVNEGFGREHIERLSGHHVEAVRAEDVRHSQPSRSVIGHDDRHSTRDDHQYDRRDDRQYDRRDTQRDYRY
jgi:hypothetical protein